LNKLVEDLNLLSMLEQKNIVLHKTKLEGNERPSVALHNEINLPDIQYYSNSLPVGKGRLKKGCGLHSGAD
jgi:hypothetical protein